MEDMYADAEFGCEHLAETITSGSIPQSTFLGLVTRVAEDDEDGDDDNEGGAKFGESRSQCQYRCLQCRIVGDMNLNLNLLGDGEGGIEMHAKTSGHVYAFHRRTWSLYCSLCRDIVYDRRVDGLRATSGRVLPTQSPSQAQAGRKRSITEMTNGDDDSYLTTNSSQRPCGREGVRGLINLGETCYMNAILQMMVHNPLLSNFFLGSGHAVHACETRMEREETREEGTTSRDEAAEEEDELSAELLIRRAEVPKVVCIACPLAEVFAESRLAEKSEPMHAVNLLFASWSSFAHMSGLGQQDSHEWYLSILDKLHESVGSVLDSKGRCKCFFHKAFFGRLRSEVTCDTCGLVSRTQEPFSDINIDFQKQVRKTKKVLTGPRMETPSLEACLTTYTSSETLPAEAYQCHQCGVPRTASKRLKIRKLSAVLCMQVKRFGVRMVGNACIEEKYEGKIDFPLSINMASYTTRPRSGQGKFLYDLETVVVHDGKRIQNGHFFAFCRQDGKWFKFDDEIVSLSTSQEVLAQEAYLLFYSLRSLGRAE